MMCPSCGFENAAGIKFCGECGKPLKVICPSCAFENQPGIKFCGQCGSPLDGAREAPEPRSYTPHHLAEKILRSRSALEGERKQVTVLFADVKGSMELAESIDPEDWHRIMERFFTILSAGVHRFEGTVNQYTGDGIMALFGAPIAHEDHARRACYAALYLREELRRYADELRRTAALNFSVRMGLNSGEVVVGKIGDDLRMDYTAQGHTVGLAARMEQLAEAGRAYLTAETARLVSGYFRLRDIGPVDLKGVSRPVEVYDLEGIGSLRTPLEVSRSRGFSRFVGRADEMASLESALGQAVGGSGKVVGVVADPGLGKSRLCFEFAERCRARGIAVYEAHGISHGKLIPFLPILELFRGFFRISADDGPDATREKIAGRMLLLDEGLRDALPLTFDFLGVPDPECPVPQMEPEARLRQLFAIVKRVVQARSRREPAVVLLEDLHWFDGGSEAVLEVLVEAAGMRTFLVVNFRPEYHAGWMQKSYYEQLPLSPLGAEAIDALLGDLLGADPSMSPLRDRIRERTGGNPFFIEEMVHSLAETKAIEGVKGAYRLSLPVAELTLPATVQAVLAARIDRLDEREKQVLQTAAVIGREFSEPVLRQVAELPEIELASALDRLAGAELIYEQALYPELRYVFKHALTQEVTYGSLLKERREMLHERAGKAIEETFAQNLDEYVSELAHHYSRSRNVEKAIEYSQRAGLRAVHRSTNVEAIKHLNTALRLLENAPLTPRSAERELGVRVGLGTALVASRGYGSAEVEDVYTVARRICHELGATDQLFPVLRGLWSHYITRSNYRTAIATAEEFFSFAEERGDSGVIAEGLMDRGFASMFLGEFVATRDYSERGIALSDSDHHDRGLRFLFGVDPGVNCRTVSALALWCLGHPVQALKRGREGVALARAVDHPYSIGWATLTVTWLAQYSRDAKAVEREAETVIAISSERGFPFWLGWATALQGWALIQQGHREDGISRMQRGIEAMRATGAVFMESYWSALLAESYGRIGQAEEALTALTEARAAVDRAEEHFFEAEIHRMKGELLLGTPLSSDREKAEDCFLEAIHVARRQHAKSWELRATTSLARLLSSQGKREEARSMLADIYGWFTEGFDTADLKDARALLDELSACA